MADVQQELFVVPEDIAMNEVIASVNEQDPDGCRMAKVFRETFDQLYDGQRTGRYKWEQLYKTEKTHFGTLIEINLQREFGFQDGELMDYKIAEHEVDCKYSASAGWMLPPESIDQLILGSVASDEKSCWSMGIVRATLENRNAGKNRDLKGSLNKLGKSRIHWFHKDAPMPPNILLQLPELDVQRIFSASLSSRRNSSGQARVNELFRTATNMRITRNVVATVAQQDDYMKRVRNNGGARSALRTEGIIILSGDYSTQKNLAKNLGAVVPEHGEFVSVKLAKADVAMAGAVEISGNLWKMVDKVQAVTDPAPTILGQ